MPKSQKNEIKTEYLLNKGMEVLWSKGYNGTSVNDIVQAADVPKGSFYFYFKNKEDFAIQAINLYFDTMISPTMEILNNKTLSARDRLIGAFELRVKMLKEGSLLKQGCLASNLGCEMAEHSTPIRKAIAKKEEFILDVMTVVTQEAQENGEITNTMSASDLVSFLSDAGKGAMMTMKLTQSLDPIDNMLHIIKHVILK